MRRGALVCAVGVLAGCGGAEPAADQSSPIYTPPDAEPPVAINAESPIQYPPALYDQKIEGDVILRLFVDSTGRLVPESTRVAESSGYPALDSAALAGAGRLRFAPARRRGIAVATAFLQPIEFRHPEGAVLKGAP
ncbi:MAG TPA: energy transducer TonB [Gemmatimonadales bacterium]|nr:energy transducer TonB [Gemmatimonadales bacterium]